MNITLFRGLSMGMLLSIFALQTSCSKDEDPLEYNDNFIESIDATHLPAANHPMTMFEDDEDPALMYNKEDRWFRVNEPLQIIQKGKDSIQISLYSPVGLKDVKVFAKLPSYDQRFVVYHFSEIPAFHRSLHQIPLVAATKDYQLEDGTIISIEKIDGFSTGSIEFSVESSDPLFAKFEKIKSSHLVQFHDGYHINEPGKFLPMNPVLAKEAITLFINYSYALSHPIYYETFTNFDVYKKEQAARAGTQVDGATDWHGNEADENGVYDYYTKDQIEEIYWNYLDDRTLYMAMVGGGAALGGGQLASQWESGYVSGHWKGDLSVWSHEFSHHVGFGHSSNLANSGEGGGQQGMLSDFVRYLLYLEDLPFTDPEVLQSWTKTQYFAQSYTKPVFEIKQDNPFLLKYKGEGTWK